jgi:hypothetical protein
VWRSQVQDGQCAKPNFRSSGEGEARFRGRWASLGKDGRACATCELRKARRKVEEIAEVARPRSRCNPGKRLPNAVELALW